MEFEVLKWVLMFVIGVCGWLMRNMIAQSQEDIKGLKHKVETLEQTKLAKDDFKEFKAELREMFNEIKIDIRDLKNSNG